MLRVVFDTNILFSSIGWRGKPSQCFAHAQAGKILAITCAEILKELSEKLAKKLGMRDEEIEAAIASILLFVEVIAIKGTVHGPQTDRDDDKILECAVLGKATHIVTGDRQHLLPLISFQGIAVVTAAQLLEAIANESPA